MLNRLHRVTCIILSLFSFFEDIKWWGLRVNVIRRLFSPKFGYSIPQSLFKQFDGFNQQEKLFFIETLNPNFVCYHENELEAIEASYFESWILAWQYFTDLFAIAPKKNIGKPKPQVEILN